MAGALFIKDDVLNSEIEAEARGHAFQTTKTQLARGLLRAALAASKAESTSIFTLIEELNRRAAKSKNSARGAA